MGLCGLSLKATTYSAATFTIIKFIAFTGLDIIILIGLYSGHILYTKNSRNGWIYFIQGLEDLNDKDRALPYLLIFRIVFRVLILLTVPLLIIGNKTSRRHYLLPWELLMSIELIVMLAETTYFLIVHNQCGFLSSLTDWMYQHMRTPSPETGKHCARFIGLLDLADGGPIIMIISILFIVYVHIRGLQIYYKKRENNRLEDYSMSLEPVIPYRIPRAKLEDEEDADDHNGNGHPHHHRPGGGAANGHITGPGHRKPAVPINGPPGANGRTTTTVHVPNCYDNFGYQTTLTNRK